jgi:hypothetical protein
MIYVQVVVVKAEEWEAVRVVAVELAVPGIVVIAAAAGAGAVAAEIAVDVEAVAAVGSVVVV